MWVNELRLHQEELKKVQVIEKQEVDELSFLSDWLNNSKEQGLITKIKILQRKIDFAKAAVNESSSDEIDDYEMGHISNSLYLSKSDIEKINRANLQNRIHSIYQRRLIQSLHNKKVYKPEICPACLGEGRVLETELGLYNRHFAQTRSCCFCFNLPNPFNDYLQLSLEDFKTEIESKLSDHYINYYISKERVSRRSKQEVYRIQFKRTYDMLPRVSESYNTIFFILTLRELFGGNYQDMNPKLISDILNKLSSPHNQIMVITELFPLYNNGFFEIPEYDFEKCITPDFVKRLEETNKIYSILDETYDHLGEYHRRSDQHQIVRLRDEFNSINPELILTMEFYEVTKYIIEILWYRIMNGMEIEDYDEDERLSVDEIIKLCDSYFNSPYYKEKLSPQMVRKWIKNGELIGSTGSRYYSTKKNVVQFLER